MFIDKFRKCIILYNITEGVSTSSRSATLTPGL